MLFERFEDWTVRAKRTARTVILNVLFVRVERLGQGLALGNTFDDVRSWNNSVAHGGELRLFNAQFLRSDEGIRANGFLHPLSMLPPLDEIASLRVNFIAPADTDMVAPDPPLCVK